MLKFYLKCKSLNMFETSLIFLQYLEQNYHFIDFVPNLVHEYRGFSGFFHNYVLSKPLIITSEVWLRGLLLNQIAKFSTTHSSSSENQLIHF